MVTPPFFSWATGELLRELGCDGRNDFHIDWNESGCQGANIGCDPEGISLMMERRNNPWRPDWECGFIGEAWKPPEEKHGEMDSRVYLICREVETKTRITIRRSAIELL